MLIEPLDLSNTATPGQIQENLIAYMRIFSHLPGVVMYDDETCFWIISRHSAPGNYILRARWTSNGVEEQIERLFATVGRHIDQIDWMLFPCDLPTDLSSRLRKRGYPSGSGGNWLWADLNAPTTHSYSLPDFRIEPVLNDGVLAEWVRLSELGFGCELAHFFDAYSRHGYGPDAQSRHYIGYMAGTPVASGSVLHAGDCASIYDVSVPMEFRRQGVGAALTQALMAEIRTLGYGDTWIWSSDMARRVYRRCGYVDAEFGLREYTWTYDIVA